MSVPLPSSSTLAQTVAATQAATRADLFGLLAVAFIDPTAASAAQLADGSYLAQLDGACAELGSAWPGAAEALAPLAAAQPGFAATSAEELLHALKVEYARLFIGPSKPAVSPYATAYGARHKEGATLLMVSPEALAVEAAYREAGVALAANRREPPDHFATELEFLYYLCQQEARCWAAGAEDEAALWQRRQAAFLDRHLLPWGAAFCRQVQEASHHPFYQALARFAGDFFQLLRGEAA